MAEIQYRMIETNGIKIHIAEQGTGPLVILLHGFPELGYSWTHQMPAIADAGFHVVAPDQRGFGKTDCPPNIDDYNMLKLVGDVIGLVHKLSEKKAIIIGHDWGSPVAWHCALLRPDIFTAVGLISVPYFQTRWGDMRPTEMYKLMQGDKEFYQYYFQEPDKVEKELEEDIRKTIVRLYWSASADCPEGQRPSPFIEKSRRFIDTMPYPDKMPSWLAEKDIEVYTIEYMRTGFRGGVNWYRCVDRNWELMQFLNGAKIQQPSIFIVGQEDFVVKVYGAALQSLEKGMPNLKSKVFLPGAGHFLTHEKPDDVNKLLVEFLKGL